MLIRRTLGVAAGIAGVSVLVVLAFSVLREQVWIRRLDSEDPHKREEAAQALSKIGSNRAIKALVELMKREAVELEQDVEAPEYAAEALGLVGGAAIPYIKDVIADADLSDTIRRFASGVLADEFPDRSLEAFLELWQKDELGCRRAVFTGLRRFTNGDGRSVELVLAGLRDRDASIRLEALQVARNLTRPSPTVTAELFRLLADRDREVRIEASFVLRRFCGYEDAVKALEHELPEVRYYALCVLDGAKLREADVRLLRTIAGSDDSDSVQKKASEVLRRLPER